MRNEEDEVVRVGGRFERAGVRLQRWRRSGSRCCGRERVSRRHGEHGSKPIHLLMPVDRSYKRSQRQREPRNQCAQSSQEPAVQVRSDFRSTILWQPDVKTDADGIAIVKVKYPDSLTTWQATARVATAGNQFGIGNSATRTKQPLIVRLQAPRFFVVGDQVTVSAVINNNTDRRYECCASLNGRRSDCYGTCRRRHSR